MKRRAAGLGAALVVFWAALAAAASEPARPGGLAGRLAFRTYGDDDGLGNPTVECLLQDRDGFLWIGTQDGLFRFDGRRFARFGRDEGLASSRINSLHQTADGRLYVGTRTGLAILAPDGSGRFLPVGPEQGVPAVDIPDQGIASGPGGEVFVGTPEGLFVGRPGGPFRPEPFPDADGTREVTALHRAPDGALLYARGGRLFRRAAGPVPETTEIGRALGLPDGDAIDQVMTDGTGRLWVRTLTQLWVLPPAVSGEDRRFRRDDEGLAQGVASGRLALDDRGRILIPTSQGLAYKDGERWRRIGRSEGLASDTVLSALVDREGSLWIGLAGSGLAQRLGRGAFTAWGSAEGMSHDVVWAITRQRDPATGHASGPLWVGTEDGLDRIDLETGEIRVFREADGLAGGTVYALAAGRDGSVWAGSWPGGITRFGGAGGGPGRIRRYGAEGIASSELRIVALYFDRAGHLWAGARSGVYRLDAGSSATLLRPVRLPGWDERDSVYGFAEDRAGTVYAVGRYGLQRLTGPNPRRFRQADGFQSDFLSSVVAAASGEPWDLIAGYREALGAVRVKVEGDRLRAEPLDLSSGLSFDKVLFLGRAASGALWVGGGAGLDVFRPGARLERSAHFSRASGLITEDMSQNAFFAEADGTVWVGTSRGLVRYRPDGEVRRPLPPPILITGAVAGRRRLAGAGDEGEPPVLERNERDLLVTWASPTFLDPSRVRFRYRLAGLERELHETSGQEARYASLPTGSYRLEVVAVSAAGLVSPRPAVLAFSVRPAWWERPWAWLAAALLLGLAVVGAVRLRTRSLEADRRRLEVAVEERSAALARAVRELEEASSTDFLTGTRNRRYLSSAVAEDVRLAAQPGGRDLLAFLVDIDHFKAVNDQYGHSAGDRILVEVARRLQEVTRASDLVVRWGGEEFLIVARAASRDEAAVFAARILDAVGGRPFELGETGHAGETLQRTCSVGWAPFPWFPEEPQALSFDQMLTLADHALYLAKRTGRDRAVGVLPLGPAAASGPRPVGWWRQPLAEADGRWARLVLTGREEPSDAGRTVAGGAS